VVENDLLPARRTSGNWWGSSRSQCCATWVCGAASALYDLLPSVNARSSHLAAELTTESFEQTQESGEVSRRQRFSKTS
jgi:hypothetical protein